MSLFLMFKNRIYVLAIAQVLSIAISLTLIIPASAQSSPRRPIFFDLQDAFTGRNIVVEAFPQTPLRAVLERACEELDISLDRDIAIYNSVLGFNYLTPIRSWDQPIGSIFPHEGGTLTIRHRSKRGKEMSVSQRAKLRENSNSTHLDLTMKLGTRKFEGSEASAFKKAFLIRMKLKDGEYVDKVELNGRDVSTDTYSDGYVKSYKVIDPSIAQALGVSPGTEFTQDNINEMNETFQAYFLDPTSYEAGAILIIYHDLDPDFIPRRTSLTEKKKISTLETEILHQFEKKNLTSPNRWYQSSEGVNLYANNNAQAKILKRLLESLENDDESAFKRFLFEFASLFPKKHAEQRSAFISTFSTLAITKQFPSQGVRGQYFHFILQCGLLLQPETHRDTSGTDG